ncbi:hypothetical protein R1sor_024986 [Riccia sorocarpa]|uniref:Uncharacterized protein n=1 Tax=Riccia sorocarpa TaxID=122646 RepID=A0ABD3G7T8_9MARC
MANLEETLCLSIHCRQGDEVLSTLHRYSRWQIEIWYTHFERLALSAPLPLAVHHSFVRDVILDEIDNRDRILAAAEDRAWVQEMPREANGWDMLAAYGLPQVPLPDLGGWVQELSQTSFDSLIVSKRSKQALRSSQTSFDSHIVSKRSKQTLSNDIVFSILAQIKMAIFTIEQLETKHTTTAMDIFECFILVVYGTFFQDSRYSTSTHKYLHADVIDKDGESTITMTCSGALCINMERLMRKHAYLRIFGFTLSPKTQFQKGDSGVYINVSSVTQVTEIQMWSPPAKPLFCITKRISNIRKQSHAPWSYTNIAVVLLEILDNNMLSVADGKEKEDIAIISFTKNNQAEYEHYSRLIRFQTEPVLLFFKNIGITSTDAECSFRVGAHTIITDVVVDSIKSSLTKVYEKQQQTSTITKVVEIDCVITSDKGELINVKA